jgi:probable rRNA maturation factor
VVEAEQEGAVWPSSTFGHVALSAAQLRDTGVTVAMIIFRKYVAGLSHAALAKFVTRTSRAVRLRGTVNVLVTSSRELCALNRRFRGQDEPTDVLSFVPQPGFGNGFAGDIAISAEIAKQNALYLGHSAAKEIKILVLHGVLHLAGYDHERDHGGMAAEEANLRQSLGLPSGLIERNGRLRKGSLKRGGGEGSTPRKASGEGARATPAGIAAPAKTR